MEFPRFKEKFEYAILRGNEKKATDREKRIGSAVAKVMIFYYFSMVRLWFVLLEPGSSWYKLDVFFIFLICMMVYYKKWKLEMVYFLKELQMYIHMIEP